MRRQLSMPRSVQRMESDLGARLHPRSLEQPQHPAGAVVATLDNRGRNRRGLYVDAAIASRKRGLLAGVYRFEEGEERLVHNGARPGEIAAPGGVRDGDDTVAEALYTLVEEIEILVGIERMRIVRCVTGRPEDRHRKNGARIVCSAAHGAEGMLCIARDADPRRLALQRAHHGPPRPRRALDAVARLPRDAVGALVECFGFDGAHRKLELQHPPLLGPEDLDVDIDLGGSASDR